MGKILKFLAILGVIALLIWALIVIPKKILVFISMAGLTLLILGYIYYKAHNEV